MTIRALLRDANKSKKILRSGSWLTAAPGQARCLTVLHQMYSRSQDTLWERYRLFFNWSLFSDDFPLGKVQKKNIKKPTNVSLYASMSAENSKMLVFFTFFLFLYQIFQLSLEKKNVSFYGICMYAREAIIRKKFYFTKKFHKTNPPPAGVL